MIADNVAGIESEEALETSNSTRRIRVVCTDPCHKADELLRAAIGQPPEARSLFEIQTSEVSRGFVPLLLRPCVNGLGEIVLGFYFLCGGVVQCLMKTLGIPPVNPPQGGQFNFSY